MNALPVQLVKVYLEESLGETLDHYQGLKATSATSQGWNFAMRMVRAACAFSVVLINEGLWGHIDLCFFVRMSVSTLRKVCVVRNSNS